MLAARWWGRGDVRVEDVPDLDDPPPGWVRIKVDACGICGTDIEEYTDGPIVIPTTPHDLSGRCAPLTLGHEAVGVVDAPGDDVTLSRGQRVAVEANLFCGECWWCGQGQYQLCPSLASLGLMADGGLAEYLIAPERMCIPYSDETSPLAAVLAEPLSVAVRALRRGRLEPGTRVGVVGTGTIGLLAVQAARAWGAETIVAVDTLPSRRSLALELGADVAVAPEDADQAALDLTDGVGLDLTVEAAGNGSAGAAAINLARRGGRTVLLGVFDDLIGIPMMDFLLGEKEVLASLSHLYDRDFAAAVSLIDDGSVRTDPLVTDRIALTDVVEHGFKALLTDPAAHLKVIVTPNGVV